MTTPLTSDQRNAFVALFGRMMDAEEARGIESGGRLGTDRVSAV